MRKRKRVTIAPVLLVNLRRIESVPKVELLPGSVFVSRWRAQALGCKPFGTPFTSTDPLPEQPGSIRPGLIVELRWTGLDRFSGPGAPSRWPAAVDVAFVSTNRKSLAL